MNLLKLVHLMAWITLLVFSVNHAQRIRVDGNKFLVGENPIFMLGANTPWNNWNDFGHTFNASWWETEFAAMHASGLNSTRVWISCNGDNASPGINASGAVTPPTETFWNHVEQLFQIAEDNQIYLMIALISFDHSKEGNTNANAWRAMYQNPQNRQSFVDNYVVPFLERFGDNPYFWAIDVGNELDWVHENDGVPIADVFDLTARVANAVHANSEVLVSLGTGAGPKYLSPTYGVNYYSDAELQKLQPGAYLDFYNNHFYDWMTEYFSTPFDNGPDDWQINEKPALIGEYSGVGHGDGYSPEECLQKAYDEGWQGVMPWTSNGVDGHGTLSDFGPVFKTWSDANQSLVFPPLVDDPGPFTLTLNPAQGGAITASPQADLYDKGTDVALIAVPDQGKELLRWSGDATGTADTVTLTMTRNMSVSAQFITAGELIRNGTFEEGASSWNLGQHEGGAATANTDNGDYQLTITNGGVEQWHVQLLQGGLSLDSGQAYTLSFDMSATAAKSVFVAVGEAGGEYTKYLEQTIELGTTTQQYSFEFTPTATTSNARVEFNVGLSTSGITLDNVSLRKGVISPVYPNPNAGKKTLQYTVANGMLQLHGIAGNTLVEGFTTGGKLLFTHRNQNPGFLSVPVGSHPPRLIFLRGSVNGKPDFLQKVVLW